jgi:hypothetical protein
MKNGVIFFVKYPVLNRVKTRLAKSIGNQHALNLYRCFTQDIFSMLARSQTPVLIFFDPADKENEVRQWLKNSSYYYAQQGNDLGAKMHHAFTKAFSLGFSQLILIGSDVPAIDITLINTAFSQLATHNSVIGPARDGGYYLVGFGQDSYNAFVFEQMEWSNAQVYAKTLEKLKQVNCTYSVLETKTDIDEFPDLVHYSQHQNPLCLQTQHYLAKNPELLCP